MMAALKYMRSCASNVLHNICGSVSMSQSLWGCWLAVVEDRSRWVMWGYCASPLLRIVRLVYLPLCQSDWPRPDILSRASPEGSPLAEANVGIGAKCLDRDFDVENT